MSTTIQAGELLVLDPSDKRVISFDWGVLAEGVTIASNTFTITTVKQNGLTILTKDNETTGSRTVQLRLDATTTTAGDKYRVASKIVTSEVPAQTIERQFTVRIQNH